ncbi:MAG: hypothetical protein HN337_04690 [Deltaproteobacteria bacterium]|nr:hypothetical protein [Deltaproteobacteria bacterium]
MPRGLRFLAIQEFFNIVGSTALEISAAFLYSHFGGEFSEALVVTIPVGSVLAHLRRVHVGLFTKRRIGIIRNGIEMGKSTIPTDIRIATPLILDGKTSSGS